MDLKSALTVSLVALLFHSLNAQITPSDTVKAQEYYDLAKSLRNQGEYDSAHTYFEKAVELFETTNNWPMVAKSILKQGLLFYNQGKYQHGVSILRKGLVEGKKYLNENDPLMSNIYHTLGICLNELGMDDDALSSHLKSLEIRQLNPGKSSNEAAYSYQGIGTVYLRKNDFDKAIKYYDSALNIRLKLGLIVVHDYNNIAAVHYYKADYFQARVFMERSLNAQLKRNYEGWEELAVSLSNLGAVAFQEGNYQKAYDYYSRSLALDLENRSPGHPDFADDYFNLAEVHEQRSEFAEAIQYYTDALHIYTSSYGRLHYDVSEVYGRLGAVFHKKGNFDKALIHYKEALDIATKIGGKLEIVATIYQQVGDTFLQQKAIDSAKYYFRFSQNLRKEIFGERHPAVAESRLRLAQLYRLQNQWKQALAECQKAFSAVSRGSDSSQREGSLSIIDNLQFDSKGIDVLSAYGKTIHGAYQAGLVPIEELKYGFSCTQSAIDLIDQKRIDFSSPEARQEFSEKYSDVFREGITMAHLLAQETNDDSYRKTSFQLAERSKSFVLSQFLQEKQLEVSFSLEDSLVEKERSLKVDIAYYKETLLERRAQEKGYDTAQVADFTDRLFNLEREFESLKNFFESEYPNYYELRYATNTISVEELQQALKNGEALIEYAWGDRHLYAFAISADEFFLERIPIDSNLISSINNMNGVLKTNRVAEFSELSSSVFQAILAPSVKSFSKASEKLIIIPDGPLARLNFDLLLTSHPVGPATWKELPYLIKDYNISNAHSATLLFSTDRNIGKSTKDLLAFSFGEVDLVQGANISMERVRSADMMELPGSVAEIKSISGLVDGDYCYGKFASEGVFKEVASDYQILHLAVHGEVDDEQPNYSKLYFNGNDSLEDGSLHAFELYNMNLNAELAVLSACNTGSGKYLAGEGIMSLGRAFSYAGVNSLLLTRWDVSDNTTPEIMHTFYRELKNGKDKSEALRMAKLAFLNQSTDTRSHPFFWGSFYILGDDKPIIFQTSNRNYFWMIGLILLFVLGYYLFKYRRKYLLLFSS